ncbi:MAG: acyl-CoA dehydrogenase [Nitriliruptorales bacterium]|nr:acyl-CoA dehydrogenase [Nitriliruptorales bacterium]
MTGPLLEPEQQDLLNLVRAYAVNEAAPRAAEAERAGAFPRDLFDQLARMDFMGLPVAAEYGGSAQPGTVVLRVIEELSRAFLTVGLGLSVHNLATWAVEQYASEEVRKEVVPRLAAGEWLGAYSLSEPGSGSDAAALVTRARRDGTDYVIDGTKAWVTGAGEADCYVVMCRTGEDKVRGISALLVPADTAGLSFPAGERKMGLQSSPTGQLVLEDARVPARYLLGQEGGGFTIAMSALDGGRLGVAAGAVGLAQAALDASVRYAREREQFGQPIGQFQGLAFMLADMATGIESARALMLQAAQRRDHGLAFGQLAAMAKLCATDIAMQVTTDAVQVFGGNGYTTDYPVERWFREAKVLQIVEGTNQIQRVVISRALLQAP